MSIIVAAAVSEAFTQAVDGDYDDEHPRLFILTQVYLLWKAWTLPPSAAAGKKHWDDDDVQESHQTLVKLKNLGTTVALCTSAEATIEAMVNSLVQFYAYIHETNYSNAQRDALLTSIIIGVLSSTKNIHTHR